MLLVLLVAAGIVASRIWMLDTPNFKPVGALALFAGFYFRRNLLAIGTVLAGLLASDFVLGFYEPPLLLAVYTSLLVACVAGRLVQDKIRCLPLFSIRRGLAFAIASLAMSMLFFLATNFAVWYLGWYPPTINGLADSYLAGVPFFRSTLISNLVFGQVLCWGYSIACSMASHTRPHPVGEAV